MRELKPFEEYLIHEFVEDYQDGLMDRRNMLLRIVHITGGIASAATVLNALGVTFAAESARAQEATPSPTPPKSPLSVAQDDERIVWAKIPFVNGDKTIHGYESRPKPPPPSQAPATPGATPVAGGLPVVLVVHENRGLTDHIKDVTRRWAVEGYVGFAVDLLSREGSTDNVKDQSQIPSILSGADPNQHVSDFKAAIEHYRYDPTVDLNKIGITGFCFGGGITWLAAEQIAELKAAVPWYGPAPPLDQIPNIKSAVFAIYSDDPNDFANNGRDKLKAALDAAGVVNEFKVYPGTQHAFNNDTSPRYNKEQALAAWKDATAWMGKYVKGSS